jgi:hypothetical protein
MPFMVVEDIVRLNVIAAEIANFEPFTKFVEEANCCAIVFNQVG